MCTRQPVLVYLYSDVTVSDLSRHWPVGDESTVTNQPANLIKTAQASLQVMLVWELWSVRGQNLAMLQHLTCCKSLPVVHGLQR